MEKTVDIAPGHGSSGIPVVHARYAATGECSPPASVRFRDRSGGKICAWISSASPASNRAAREHAKGTLVSFLWSHTTKMLYTGLEAQEMRSHAPVLGTDRLGKPYLLVHARTGPAVSFTYGPGMLWGCMAHGTGNVGIDVAWAGEFESGYPYDRVFAPEELTEGLARDVGGKAEAAALLWSAKEAAVKALGCGFHLVSPREIILVPGEKKIPARGFGLDLAGRARRRLGIEGTGEMEIVTCWQRGLWLSVAASLQHMQSRAVHARQW